jgi:hypothetical protein
MKTVPKVLPVIAALVLGLLPLSAAGSARLKFLAAMYFDDKGGGISAPEGVTCDAKGNVVVGDTGNGRLLRFTYRDHVLGGGAEIKIPELTVPSKLQLTSKGEILALDGRLRRIVRLSAQGEFKDALAFDGVPNPSSLVPRSFGLDQADNIYVLDTFSGRILVLNAQGKFQSALALPAEAGFVTDVTVDSTGTILALDALNRRVYSAAKGATTFTPVGGDLTKTLETMPTSLTASRGSLFIMESTGSRIVVLGQDGTVLGRQLTMGWEEGQLNHPAQICINDKDEVFVADRDNSRIQVFQLTR